MWVGSGWLTVQRSWSPTMPAVKRGLPLGYTIVPANEHERQSLADLLTCRLLRRSSSRKDAPFWISKSLAGQA
jgi:hypothetical protein